MTRSTLLTSLSHRISALRRDEDGVSAVEFAMLLPLMITLYLGTVEISKGVSIDRKVTLTTRTVADLASQASSINGADMTNLLNASTAVMYGAEPNYESKIKVTVSQVKIDANGTATIDWSETKNGTKRAKGSSVTLPAALKTANTWLIWSEVQYNYVPTIGYVVTGALNLSDQIYMRPRLSDQITYTP